MHVSEVTSLKTELQEALAEAETQRAAAQERQQDCVDAANEAARARAEQEAAECAAAFVDSTCVTQMTSLHR